MVKSRKKKGDERDSVETLEKRLDRLVAFQRSSERKSRAALYGKRDRALERLIDAWNASERSAGEYDLNPAIDALALAQVAVTFEMFGEPQK